MIDGGILIRQKKKKNKNPVAWSLDPKQFEISCFWGTVLCNARVLHSKTRVVSHVVQLVEVHFKEHGYKFCIGDGPFSEFQVFIFYISLYVTKIITVHLYKTFDSLCPFCNKSVTNLIKSR